MRGRSGFFGRILPVLLSLALLFSHAAAGEDFVVTHYTLQTDRVAEPLRLVYLSDLHRCEYGKDNADLIAAVAAEAPDLILSGGDLNMAGEPDYEGMVALFRALSAIAPCVGAPGNHEQHAMELAGDTELPARFAGAGLPLLCNETMQLTLKGTALELAGVYGSDEEEFLELGGEALRTALAADFSGVRIVLCHVPALMDGLLGDVPCTLALSGHVHGGLINLPVVGPIFTNEEGFFPKLTGGEYPLRGGGTLIIGRGLGNSTILLRFRNPPEVVVVELVPGAGNGD